MSILAATLTTMGALVIIFFLDEKIRLNLQDFAAVVIINLAVSLFVALFFVPADRKDRVEKEETPSDPIPLLPSPGLSSAKNNGLLYPLLWLDDT